MNLNFSPVIVLIGGDSVSKDTYLEEWINKWTKPEDRDFNLDVLYGNEISGNDIVNRAVALPMFSDHRTIIVHHANKIKKQDVEILCDYVKTPSPSTALIFEAENLDKRIKSWQTISKASQIIEYKVPYPDKIPDWIIRRCREKYKRRINVAAARLLFDCVGNNLSELEGELNKLDIFINKGQQISVDIIMEIIGQRADDVYKWLQAIGSRNIKKALLTIDNLMETDKNATGPLALLARHFYVLLKINMLQKKKLQEKAIAAKLGLSYYFHFVKLGFGKQSKIFSTEEIEKTLEKITETDKLIKSSSGHPRLAIESLVFDICHGDSQT